MVSIPTIPSWWSRQKMTALRLNEISANLRFLAERRGGFCELTQTIAQPIPNDTDFAVVFQNEDVDRDGGHSDLEQLSRYVARTDGWYAVAGMVAYEANATGYRSAKIVKNFGTAGAQNLSATLQPAQTGTGVGTYVPIAGRIIWLDVGEWVEMVARQNSGTTLNTELADGGAGMSVVWVAA